MTSSTFVRRRGADPRWHHRQSRRLALPGAPGQWSGAAHLGGSPSITLGRSARSHLSARSGRSGPGERLSGRLSSARIGRAAALSFALGVSLLAGVEPAYGQGAPVCGGDFKGRVSAVVGLRDGAGPVSISDDELAFDVALVVNDFLRLLPELSGGDSLPASLRGVTAAQVRVLRDRPDRVPAICDIVGYMDGYYKALGSDDRAAFDRSDRQLPLAQVGSARSSSDGQGVAVVEPVETDERPGQAIVPAVVPGVEPSPRAVAYLEDIDRLLAIPPYPTRRDVTSQRLKLTRRELQQRRRDALRARESLLEVFQALAADPMVRESVRSALGEDGRRRVERGILGMFADSRAARDRIRALELWRLGAESTH